MKTKMVMTLATLGTLLGAAPAFAGDRYCAPPVQQQTYGYDYGSYPNGNDGYDYGRVMEQRGRRRSWWFRRQRRDERREDRRGDRRDDRRDDRSDRDGYRYEGGR